VAKDSTYFNSQSFASDVNPWVENLFSSTRWETSFVEPI